MLHKLLACSFVFAVALSSSPHSNAALVAHWTGDNTATDASGNGHDGTVNGATYTNGVADRAFAFDGLNDVVTVAADTALEPANLSVSLWVRTATENHLRVLIDSTHGTGQAGWALQVNPANNLTFAYGNGTTFPQVESAFGATDGEFHHLVATLDGSTMQLYVDGSPTSSIAYTGTPKPSGRDIQIGHSPVLNRPFQGALDDIRIYNHALSPSEVQALASIPEPSSLLLVCGSLLFGVVMSRGYRRA